jgi:predicted extracellular nuclease
MQFPSTRWYRWALPLLLLATAPLDAQVVISQVYGGGGNSGATLKNDFIEIFNRGTAAVNVTGWSVQYAASTGTSWQATALTGTIGAGRYLLVQEAAGAAGTVDLPAPDIIGVINMSATTAKVALVNTATELSGACPTDASIQDFLGYGTANCSEGSPAPTLTNTTAALRAGAGCIDTNSNSADFATGAPSPRNSATAPNTSCAAAGLTIGTPSPLPGATLGLTYSLTFTASGGTGTGYSFTQPSGTLPPGLALTGATLSGTPNTTTGSPFTFTIQVMDSGSNTASKSFQLSVTLPTCAVTNTIAQIQGSGDASPLVGRTVTTSGIVTGRKSNGFFIQMPPPGDSDPATSDGVFVFTSSAPPSAAAAGNSVCVTGTVAEFAPASDPASPTNTEIDPTSVTLLAQNQALPAPVVLTTSNTKPDGGINQLEKYEGMRVQVSTLNVVAPTRGSINEANATSTSAGIFYGVLPGIPRPFREAGVQLPDPLPAGSPCCVPRWDTNPEILAVNTLAQTGGTAIDVTTGAIVTNLVGPLEYSGRAYAIDTDPGTPPSATGNITYTAVPLPLDSELTVASFNAQRFFDTTDDPAVQDVVLTSTAFANRLNKASLAIRNVMRYPDIIGVEEMENLPTLQALANKVNTDAAAAGLPNPNYQAYLVEGNDIGGIDVGFLVKKPKVTVIDVTQIGKAATYTNPNNNQEATLWDRPPLVLRATAARAGSDEPLAFTAIVVHPLSLTSVDDPTDGNRVRHKRRAEAEYLANYVQGRQTANPGENIVMLGDWNAFEFSDGYVDFIGTVKGVPAPADQVVEASADLVNPDLTDLVDAVLPAEQRYSYSFNGSAQTLDHIIVNRNMLAKVTRMIYARNDADFPEVYRNDSTRPERISDHDMPVAYFNLPRNHTARPPAPRPIGHPRP